jgi:hypothetical protein
MQASSASSVEGTSGDVVRVLAHMLRDEPVVRQGLRLIQNHCLSGGGGLQLRFAHNVPPTPSFARHLQRYYVDFCRQAIEAFLSVGFAAYRLRRLKSGARIPELLPLGTYTWHVARSSSASSSASRGGAAAGWYATLHDPRVPPTTSSKKARVVVDPEEEVEEAADGPLLCYNVSTTYSHSPVHVYAFTPPHPMFVCASPLMSVVQSYVALCHKRECVLRADLFNSQPGLVIEQQDKAKINDVTHSGLAIVGHTSEMLDRQAGDRSTLGGRQDLHYGMLDEFRERSHLPQESVTFIAPTNHVVHSLDRVTTPLEMPREELAFARRTAGALGLPEAMLLQGSGAVGSGSSGSGGAGSAQSWSESAESNNRQVLDTCRHINRHLEALLGEVYAHIYGGGGSAAAVPRFRLTAVPTFSLEQLLLVFNARLIEDDAFSAILEAAWGTGLGAEALHARAEQRKADYVLPFRDKKDPPKKK